MLKAVTPNIFGDLLAGPTGVISSERRAQRRGDRVFGYGATQPVRRNPEQDDIPCAYPIGEPPPAQSANEA
jgi:hypothetical protein